MPLLPYQTFTLDTHLSVNETYARLRSVVEPRRRFRWSAGEGRPFEGEVENDGFAITRIINYRNSFLPQIRGRVIPTPTGARIEGTMRLHALVLAFLIFWCGSVSIGGGMVVRQALVSGQWSPTMLIPFGMVIFSWALSAGAFTYEARKALQLLREQLEVVKR
jgi:hypothetical protein